MSRAQASGGGLADELPEVFERFGRIAVRRMFGGHGIFHEDRMFGLVSGGRVYLKTDEENRPLFVDKRLAPFEYARRGEMTATSYYEAPAEIFEDRDEAARWAQLAWGAVLRKGSGGGRATKKKAAPSPQKKKRTPSPQKKKRTPSPQKKKRTPSPRGAAGGR